MEVWDGFDQWPHAYSAVCQLLFSRIFEAATQNHKLLVTLIISNMILTSIIFQFLKLTSIERMSIFEKTC